MIQERHDGDLDYVTSSGGEENVRFWMCCQDRANPTGFPEGLDLGGGGGGEKEMNIPKVFFMTSTHTPNRETNTSNTYHMSF